MKLLRVSEKLRVTLSQYIKSQNRQTVKLNHTQEKKRKRKEIKNQKASFSFSQRPSPFSFLRSGSGFFSFSVSSFFRDYFPFLLRESCPYARTPGDIERSPFCNSVTVHGLWTTVYGPMIRSEYVTADRIRTAPIIAYSYSLQADEGS